MAASYSIPPFSDSIHLIKIWRLQLLGNPPATPPSTTKASQASPLHGTLWSRVKNPPTKDESLEQKRETLSDKRATRDHSENLSSKFLHQLSIGHFGRFLLDLMEKFAIGKSMRDGFQFHGFSHSLRRRATYEFGNLALFQAMHLNSAISLRQVVRLPALPPKTGFLRSNSHPS